MLLAFWFTLFAYCSALDSWNDKLTTVEIKIGFLVGSKRLKHSQSYLQPGRQLLHVFHHALNKMNQLYSSNQFNSTAPNIKLVPVIAETFGDESVSIKKTIALMIKQAVDFIVGPQETCQVESRLASVFNIAMISHYCSQWSSSNHETQFDRQPVVVGGNPMTFIQTKPPHWKIVERVVTLVGQLLEAHNRYPQNLVLLYFKEPSLSNNAETNDKRLHLSNSTGAGYNRTQAKLQQPQQQQQQQQQYQPTSDAIQYKLIGELLEIKLNELLSARRLSAGGGGGSNKETGGSFKRKRAPSRPLAVLNWHTTYHYGFTKNPFRQLIRRHLFQQQQSVAAAAATNQCDFIVSPSAGIGGATNRPKAAATMARPPNDRPAIYIVVGHYYEHLGLMMALSELDLLGNGASCAATGQDQQSGGCANQQGSLVIGVDTEEYDERDDSVRFLRGLLMDETTNEPSHNHRLQSEQQASSTNQLDTIAAMYGHYLGVVPAKPTRMAEILDEMRQSLYNQTTDPISSSAVPPKQLPLEETSGQRHNIDGAKLISEQPFAPSNRSTSDALQLTSRLLQFMRLPVEAFYLYDSISLIGAYFGECIQSRRLPLEQCRDGRRAREWFKNRQYTSVVNENLTRFDSQAQTEGLFTLITRRAHPPSSLGQLDLSEAGNEDEFGLIPVGQFATPAVNDSLNSVDHKVDLFANYDLIDPVWLPFWCFVRKSNNTACAHLLSEAQTTDPEGTWLSYNNTFGLTSLTLLTVCLTLATGYLFIQGYKSLRSAQVDRANLGWFSEVDERNFLKIVYSYLLSPEILYKREDDEDNLDNQAPKKRILVELHCHMFPFPSCRFVHWLTALHQLKEMMFQYLPEVNNDVRWQVLLKTNIFNKQAQAGANCNSRGFFIQKHKGTSTLRLLLNKYKSINECFCYLSELNHKSIVKLYGITLVFNDYGKTARLVVEQPDRGNLRQALRELRGVLKKDDNNDIDEVESVEFMSLLVFSVINDLLNGLEYLHKSCVGFHGELRATTCLIAANWRLKLSGFHTAHMRRSLGDYEQKNASSTDGLNQNYLDDLLYAAPEVLENHNRRGKLDTEAMRLADIYSFGFIFYELLASQEPWTCLTHVSNSKLLLERVKVESSFRPPLSRLDKSRELKQVKAAAVSSCSSIPACPLKGGGGGGGGGGDDGSGGDGGGGCIGNDGDNGGRSSKQLDLDAIQQLIRSCWSHLADRRPQSVATLRNRLLDCCLSCKSSINGKKIHGQVVKCYAKLLELVALYRKENLALERKRSKEFELKLLPESVVDKLRNNPTATYGGKELFASRKFEFVSFCSFRILIIPDGGQHQLQDDLNLLEQLNEILDQLDKLVSSYQKHIHLLESQVDSSMRFMVYSGEPFLASAIDGDSYNEANSQSQMIASFALQLIDLSNRWQSSLGRAAANMRVRCGLHNGSAMVGLLSGKPIGNDGGQGSKLARYILLGSSMQMANALESSSLPQRIHISTDFRKSLIQSISGRLKGFLNSECRQDYVMIKREGKIFVKEMGEFESYWLLNGPRLTASQSLMLVNTNQ